MSKMNYSLIMFFLSGLCAQVVYSANTLTDFNSSSPTSYVVTLSGGPIVESAGQSQTLNLTPEIQKTYTTNRSTRTLGDGELFLGIQKSLSHALLAQVGISATVTSDATLSGDIWDDADPTFNNYTYRYNVNHSSLALKGKLLGDWGYIVLPWISASIGAGFNRASNFSNTPTISEAIPNPNFTDYTNTAFTYTIGIGFQRPIAKNWQIGFSYEFADWGKSQLDSASGQTIGNGLLLSHLYTQAILFNLSYIS